MKTLLSESTLNSVLLFVLAVHAMDGCGRTTGLTSSMYMAGAVILFLGLGIRIALSLFEYFVQKGK